MLFRVNGNVTDPHKPIIVNFPSTLCLIWDPQITQSWANNSERISNEYCLGNQHFQKTNVDLENTTRRQCWRFVYSLENLEYEINIFKKHEWEMRSVCSNLESLEYGSIAPKQNE